MMNCQIIQSIPITDSPTDQPTSPLPIASFLQRCKIVNKYFKLKFTTRTTLGQSYQKQHGELSDNQSIPIIDSLTPTRCKIVNKHCTSYNLQHKPN